MASGRPAQRSGPVQRRRRRRPDDGPEVVRRTRATASAEAVVEVAVGGTRLGAAGERAGPTDDGAGHGHPLAARSPATASRGCGTSANCGRSRSGDRHRPWREAPARVVAHLRGRALQEGYRPRAHGPGNDSGRPPRRGATRSTGWSCGDSEPCLTPPGRHDRVRSGSRRSMSHVTSGRERPRTTAHGPGRRQVQRELPPSAADAGP